ncbi:MAG: 30S ribosomal protein S18 [Bacteroidia bacterium]|nr:30S ribosomal protein S18 [Bacteroidia bacterium]
MSAPRDKNFVFTNTPQAAMAKKYCRFKKHGIKYVDFKDSNFLLKFMNEQGKILPGRITGTSEKYQRKVATAVKRARFLALLPFVADGLK